MDQIVVINKPKNWTSNDVVRKIKKSLSVKKVGHGGTLDPLATGVLIIGIGKATKQLNHHLNDVKKYLEKNIKKLKKLETAQLLEERYDKIRNFGKF